MIKETDIKKAEQELKSDRITVGLATCGIAAGAKPVFEALKKSVKLPVKKVGCIGMCYNEPIVTVVQNGKKSIYAKVTKENVAKLIESIKNGEVCSELLAASDINDLGFYKKQKRLIMANCGIVDPASLPQYMAVGGYKGLRSALKSKPLEVVDLVLKSGLRGRGGAGFPTGRKWQLIAGKKGKKYILCNGDEGDPGAFMNRVLMESDPFRIIEGMTIGSYATGADEGIIYTRAEYPLAIGTLQKAIDLAYKNNLLGKDILGVKGFNFDLSIRKGAGAFVCGEETALIASIEGRRGNPSPRPPYPAIKGLYGKPTVLNNVGTWGHVATILKMGVDEYLKIGTEKTKGTKVVCLTGKVKRSGVVEVPMGIKLKEIVYDIGGGAPEGSEIKAVQSGGPAGGCIPASYLKKTKLDYETINELGAIMGSGGLVVIDNDSCMVDVARYFMKFTQSESCGKCTPCREGTKRLLEMLNNFCEGKAKPEDIDKIRTLAVFICDTALCGLGQNAPKPVLSTLKYYKDEYIAHTQGKCPAGVCKNLITFEIDKNRCKGCGMCAQNCPAKIISGNAQNKYEIDQSKCIHCGTCYDVCPFGAIDKK